MPNFLRQHAVLFVGLLTIVLSGPAWGQVSVHALPGFEPPMEKVTVLFETTCRVVAEEFHLHDASDGRVPITLVLGEAREGVVGDETNQVFTVYLPRWDETMFATAVSRIALQHLLSRDRKTRIVRESLRRANLAAPVSISALRTSGTRQSDSRTTDLAPTSPRAALNPAARCFSAASPFPAEGADRHRSPAFCPPGAQFAP
jgi:hypothetical protein